MMRSAATLAARNFAAPRRRALHEARRLRLGARARSARASARARGPRPALRRTHRWPSRKPPLTPPFPAPPPPARFSRARAAPAHSRARPPARDGGRNAARRLAASAPSFTDETMKARLSRPRTRVPRLVAHGRRALVGSVRSCGAARRGCSGAARPRAAGRPGARARARRARGTRRAAPLEHAPPSLRAAAGGGRAGGHEEGGRVRPRSGRRGGSGAVLAAVPTAPRLGRPHAGRVSGRPRADRADRARPRADRARLPVAPGLARSAHASAFSPPSRARARALARAARRPGRRLSTRLRLARGAQASSATRRRGPALPGARQSARARERRARERESERDEERSPRGG